MTADQFSFADVEGELYRKILGTSSLPSELVNSLYPELTLPVDVREAFNDMADMGRDVYPAMAFLHKFILINYVNAYVDPDALDRMHHDWHLTVSFGSADFQRAVTFTVDDSYLHDTYEKLADASIACDQVLMAVMNQRDMSHLLQFGVDRQFELGVLTMLVDAYNPDALTGWEDEKAAVYAKMEEFTLEWEQSLADRFQSPNPLRTTSGD